MRQAIWPKTSTNKRKKTPATSRKTIPPTRVKGLKKPPIPRDTLPVLRTGAGVTGIARGVPAGAGACAGPGWIPAWVPARRSPAIRPATRTPSPRNLPIFCALIPSKMVTRDWPSRRLRLPTPASKDRLPGVPVSAPFWGSENELLLFQSFRLSLVALAPCWQ